MEVLSHRGYWKALNERNATVAFERSFALGYGTETDVRDAEGRLVISHDVPVGGELQLSDVLRMADRSGGRRLALNVKADGLAQTLRRELAGFSSVPHFVFDMSVPDMRSYISAGVPVFSRMSEVERTPVWLHACAGVWLDAFDEPLWFTADVITALLDAGKRVCVVSGELHKRDHLPLWHQLKPLAARQNLMLCTDLPEAATGFFSPI